MTNPSYRTKKLTAAEKHAIAVNRKFALHEAALTDNTQLIDEIVQLHPEQLHLENGNGFTPLEQAVWIGTSVALERLIHHGADVNIRDGFGQTPLHIACTTGNLQKVTLLVQHGADINATRSDGYRPIHYALIANQGDIIRFLKGKGVHLDLHEAVTKEALKTAKSWKQDT